MTRALVPSSNGGYYSSDYSNTAPVWRKPRLPAGCTGAPRCALTGAGSPRIRNERMSYTISIAGSRKYLRVRIEGDVSTASAREWSAALREASRAQDIRRFLIDARSSMNVSTVLENYRYAYGNSHELQLEKNVRRAILTSPGDRSHDMVVTFMRNAGYNARGFTDEPAAIAWLETDAS